MRLSFVLPALLLLTLAASTSVAQVSKVKEKAETQKDNNSSTSGKSSSGSSYEYSSNDSYSDGAGCAEGIINIGCMAAESGCMDEACSGCGEGINGFFNGWADYQARIVARKDTMPYVSGLELSTTGSYDLYQIYGAQLLMPRVRATYGMFSTDYRISILRDETATLTTDDWQILSLNLGFSNQVRFHIGSGISYFRASQATYMEHSCGMDVYMLNRKLQLRSEYRWVMDYREEPENIREDLSLNIGYQFFQASHFDLVFQTGFQSQSYFKSSTEPSQFRYVSAGLRCSIF